MAQGRGEEEGKIKKRGVKSSILPNTFDDDCSLQTQTYLKRRPENTSLSRADWVLTFRGKIDPFTVLFQLLVLAPVVQSLSSAIHQINHYPEDKY